MQPGNTTAVICNRLSPFLPPKTLMLIGFYENKNHGASSVNSGLKITLFPPETVMIGALFFNSVSRFLPSFLRSHLSSQKQWLGSSNWKRVVP